MHAVYTNNIVNYPVLLMHDVENSLNNYASVTLYMHTAITHALLKQMYMHVYTIGFLI